MSTTLRTKFRTQRWDAERRGIAFLLTFEQWIKIWAQSGHLAERGPRKGQYVMARPGDRGNYEIGNVKIVLSSKNNSEAASRPKSKQMRKRLSAARTGRKFTQFSDGARRNMSVAHVGLTHSARSLTKMRKIAEHRPRDSMGMFT